MLAFRSSNFRLIKAVIFVCYSVDRCMMTDKLVVGIVMRTKNRIALLRRALESVLGQTYHNWHLYIVNDGGFRDDVDSLVEHFDGRFDSRITIIHNSVSTGMESASNVALRQMKANLAIIHDDDDTLAPDFLKRMIAVYQTERVTFPSVAGVACHCNRVLESVVGNLVTIDHSEPFNQWLEPGFVALDRMLESNVFPPICFLFELEVCRKIGYFNEKLQVLGDWDFHIRFLLERDIWLLPETLAFYHHRRDNAGDLGNSVVASSDKHKLYRGLIRNQWLRNDLASGKFGVGAFIALRTPNARPEH